MNMFNRIKNSVDNLIGDEKIGETNSQEKLRNQQINQNTQKKKSVPSLLNRKQNKKITNTVEQSIETNTQEENNYVYYDGITETENSFDNNYNFEEEYDYLNFSSDENKDKEKHNVLEILNIPLTRNSDGLLTSQEVENVEFTLTSPTGLAVEEVSNFLFKVEQAFDSYNNLLNERNQDFLILLEQCEKLEQEIISMKQENELSSLIGSRLKEEDKLRQEIVNLRLENEKLQEKIHSLDAAKKMFETVKSQQTVKKETIPKKENIVVKKKEDKPKDVFDSLLDELDF